MTRKIPERKEVPAEYTWDLSGLFPSEADWEESLKEFQEKLPEIEKFRGTLGDSAAALFTCLEFMNELDKTDERLGYYAHLRTTEDGGDSARQERFSRYLALSAQKAALASYQTPEIQAIPDGKMRDFLDDPVLDEFKIVLSKILKFKKHVLSENEERILAMQTESREAPNKAFGALTNVDLDFGSVDTPEGPKPLTQTTFSAFMQDEDRTVRQKAYLQFYSTFDSHKNTLAALYEGSVLQDVYLAKVRNYPSARAMSLFPDEVSESVYDNLIAKVRENLKILHRYYGIRKKALSVDSLKHWDVYVPLVKNIRMTHTYEEAVEIIVKPLPRWAKNTAPYSGQDYAAAGWTGTKTGVKIWCILCRLILRRPLHSHEL